MASSPLFSLPSALLSFHFHPSIARAVVVPLLLAGVVVVPFLTGSVVVPLSSPLPLPFHHRFLSSSINASYTITPVNTFNEIPSLDDGVKSGEGRMDIGLGEVELPDLVANLFGEVVHSWRRRVMAPTSVRLRTWSRASEEPKLMEEEEEEMVWS
ncbi:hypothetical protein Scep_002410 [Stephania cephalantha]|uniref:Uncharacterized protein n=1 Tax=Stephania cephalantha TaxID=152367 RepID=A0AAP0LDX4_9MAGN